MKETLGVPVSTLHCAATRDELEVFDLQRASVLEPGLLWQSSDGLFAVTGVGIPYTVLTLTRLLERYRPEVIVNIGIAGAYRGSGLEIGDVVLGVSETFADLGMETGEGEGFIPLGTMAFADESLRAPLPLAVPRTTPTGCKRGRGATVNACTGTDATGARRRTLFDVDFETMEGAAVALTARGLNIPVVEIRAISNHAAHRDMRPEHITCALTALTKFWGENGRSLIDAVRSKQAS